MDDYHFSNIAKKINKLYIIILGKIKIYNSIEIRHILCNENKLVKDLMNAYLNWHWIYKDFKQFKQKNICRLIHDMQFLISFFTFKILFLYIYIEYIIE
jgi:hypothetical protein